jgi:hypothetical protein
MRLVYRLERPDGSGPLRGCRAPLSTADGFNYDDANVRRWPPPRNDGLDPDRRPSNCVYGVRTLSQLRHWFNHCRDQLSGFVVTEYLVERDAVWLGRKQVAFLRAHAHKQRILSVNEVLS